MVKVSPKMLVHSYSFADIMTQDRYVAFKIVPAVDQGIFYKVAKIHSPIFNTFVVMNNNYMLLIPRM